MKKGSILLFLAILLWFLGATRGLETERESLGKQRLEAILRQSAASCYAAEGIYPPDVSYMEAHYGLRFDKGRYLVRYEIAASNLMPEITVLEVLP